MVLCMIVGCSNKSGRHKVSFYRVPTVVKNQGEFMEELTAERRRKWISVVSREDLTDKILENDRVCGEHFVSGKPAASWDRHSIDWVPTLKLGHSKVKVKNPQAAAERAGRATKRRLQHEVDEERLAKMLNLAEPGETVKYIFTGTMPAEPQDLELSVNETEAGEADDDISDLQAHLSGHDHEMGIPDFVGLDGGARKAQNFAQDVATQTEEFDFMKYSNKPKPFDEDYFKNDDEKTRFYTGLPSFEVLKKTFNFVAPFVARRSTTLKNFQEFILVLMKLRINVPYQDLAYRFEISVSTVSRIISEWLTVMDVRLSPLISWPEREDLWKTMPQCFTYSFGTKTTVIIDCFEIFIHRPSNLHARAQTFSNYKHHNTIKVLIGITPQGTISFVSEAWGGRTSDKFLTENSGFLKLLKPGDLVMADRGFTIEESVWYYQAKLAIPAFTKGKDQLDPVDVEKTRGIANVRIHVERVIGLLRQKYTILQSTLPIDFLLCDLNEPESSRKPLVDKMIRVCAALVNLCPPIIPFD